MAKIVAVTSCPTGIAHTFMAAEGVQRGAEALGHSAKVETQGSVGAQNVLTDADIRDADVVIIAADTNVDTSRFAGKPVYSTSTKAAIKDGPGVVQAALAQAESQMVRAVGEPLREAAPATGATTPLDRPARIVAVTSCPTGIAHTFMAAEGVQRGAEALGHSAKVETQGSVGAQNVLTDADIRDADVVIIAADTNVDTSRFAGKPVYSTSTKAAINDGSAVVRTALEQAMAAPAAAAGAAPAAAKVDYVTSVQEAKAAKSSSRSGFYKHLMTGVSYMLPFVIAGGLLIALAFAVGGINVTEAENTFGAALFTIGARAGFTLIVPILAGFIAYSIADRPGLAPGMIGGVLAASLGAGFLGGIIAGFIAGYVTNWLNKVINLPRNLAGLKPILILPLLGTLIVGLLMVYVVGTPVSAAVAALTAWLSSMQTSGAVVLGLILGGMMAVDMGGPVNKSAYTFAVGLISAAGADASAYEPMAAVMAAGMTPPLGLALASMLFKNRFTAEEREAGKAAAVLGISFITEGAIPFAARDPFRVIPSVILGSAVTGALSMLFSNQLRVPHGGIFVLAIPQAVTNLPMYVVAIVAGTLVTAAALYLLKRPIEPTTVTDTAPAVPATRTVSA
ncbi:MAG TPA: PTS fructose-like transporter subunit IIB [Herpetosiphonaceae bacterium]